MSTWHQRKAQREGRAAPLYDSALWTVVTDPPERQMTVMRFGNSHDAYIHAGQCEYSYVLPPTRELT